MGELVLILGGTVEARRLAAALARDARAEPILSLAGLTEAAPAEPGVTMRRGGFGGAPGLRRFLETRGVAALVDATHPYAVLMSRNARRAAAEARVPLLRLERPAWTPEPGERWLEASDMEAAAAAPECAARVFLAIGPHSASAFSARPDLWCALRRVDPTRDPFPLARGAWVVGRPPFTEEAERRLFSELDVAWLVTKNSGGDRAKLRAARALGLRVVMVARPQAEANDAVACDVDAALAWIETPPGSRRR